MRGCLTFGSFESKSNRIKLPCVNVFNLMLLAIITVSTVYNLINQTVYQFLILSTILYDGDILKMDIR